MRVYLRGAILSVSAPEKMKNSETLVQHCVIQHEFNQQEPRFNKYVVFEVIGEERIRNLALKPQEEVEVTMDMNARMGNAGRWFNSISVYNVERDKSKFHRYQDMVQRVAVMPGAPGTNTDNQP